jgi:ribosomal protein S18 acetylase RimI-like enzyme
MIMVIIRRALPGDLSIIVDYRITMFQTFVKDPYDWDRVKTYEVKYFLEKMEQGLFAAWVGETEKGKIIACAAVSFYELAPKPWNLESRYAFISSMYTEPEFRRQGIGGRLLKEALEYSRQKGITYATLHASKSGKSLYESHGFSDTNEMRMKL